MKDAPSRVGRFLREDKFPAFAIELGTPRNELFYVFGAFGDERFDGLLIA